MNTPKRMKMVICMKKFYLQHRVLTTYERVFKYHRHINNMSKTLFQDIRIHWCLGAIYFDFQAQKHKWPSQAAAK